MRFLGRFYFCLSVVLSRFYGFFVLGGLGLFRVRFFSVWLGV